MHSFCWSPSSLGVFAQVTSRPRLLTLGLKKEQGQEQADPGLAGARTPVPEGG